MAGDCNTKYLSLLPILSLETLYDELDNEDQIEQYGKNIDDEFSDVIYDDNDDEGELNEEELNQMEDEKEMSDPST